MTRKRIIRTFFVPLEVGSATFGSILGQGKRPALVPWGDPEQEAPIWLDELDGNLGEDDQRAVYEGLLHAPWLASGVRYAIMRHLGMSVSEEKNKRNKYLAATWRRYINEMKKQIRESGKPLQGKRLYEPPSKGLPSSKA